MPADRARPGIGVKGLYAFLGAAALLILAELAIGPWSPFRREAPSAPLPELRIPVGLPANYDEALRAADLAILDARGRLEIQREWLSYEMLAQALLAKARLTGSFDDYEAVAQALRTAGSLAPEGAGPDMRRAAFDMTMHRLGAAGASLDRVDRYGIRSRGETLESEAIRGDIALYRGDYAEAARRYAQADAVSQGASDFRRGVLAADLGRFDEATEYFSRSRRDAALPTRHALANVELALGSVELRRGAWERAAAHFAKADKLFPGYWLIEAHRAQSLALAGRRVQAVRTFEAIAKRHPAPEVMDALASLYRTEGNPVRAREWAARAGATWDARLKQFPEAAYGHAIEHQLAFGDPARALDLARRDHANRPHGATATALGFALLASNRPAEALQVIQPVLASPWRSAEAHVVAAQAYTLLGDGERAQSEQDKALAINPRALDPAAALIWFGH